MYPKVKVREQEEYDDQFDFETRSLQSLKAPEFLSSNDFSSPDDSPPSVVRVLQLHSSSSGSLANTKQKVLEENITNIRASPVSRPRAVLSSPDNDQIIGNKNKTRDESPYSSKKKSSFTNVHAKCKIIPRPVTADGSVNTRRELREVALSKGDLQTRQRTATADRRPKVVNLRKGKPDSVQDRALSHSPMNK